MSETPEVLTQVEDGVLIVTMNRPEAKNAMNKAQAEGISAAMDRLEADNDLRCAILALRGQVLSFSADPGLAGASAVQHWADGAVLMQAGRILAVGDGSSLRRRHPDAEWRHHPDGLILPGFIDAHVHYPQLPIIGAWGEQLLDWLQRYTYPAELALADPEVARALAGRFLQACLQHGTTSAAVFCSVHPHSAEALFQAAEDLGMRLLARS